MGRALGFALTASLAACVIIDGGDTSAGATTASTTMESSTTMETETAGETGGEQICDCIPVEGIEPFMPWDPSLPTCPAEACPVIEAQTSTQGGTGGDEETVVMNPEAVTCALEALRDRTPKLLRWDEDIDGWGYNAGYVFIRDDGLAIHRAWSRLDLDGEVGDAVLGELHSADHFQGCLDDPDETARLDCARAPLASSSLVCDQGWNSTTF